MNERVSNDTLTAMTTYYRARAAEYDEWWYRQGRYDRGAEANARWFAEADEVFAALDALHLTGDVLELAPGTGIWTERLARSAATITAVDASPEMLAINQAKLGRSNIAYVVADLWTWQPERVYDGVCFGFWISHVPRERLPAFLHSVAAALKSGGKVFWVDGRRVATSTAHDHELPTPDSQIMTRKLNDGRSYQIVKNFYDRDVLETECAAAGLDVEVRETATYFTYGAGTRR